MSKARIVVVGGGIIGLMTAWELAEAGCAVTLCERNRAALEASWAGGGILMPLEPWAFPQVLEPLLAWSRAAYPKLAAVCRDRAGIDPEWLPSGALLFGAAHKEAIAQWATRCAEPAKWLNAADLTATEPLVSSDAGAFLLPNVAQVRNPRLLQGLYRLLPAIGVDVRLTAEVTGLRLEDGRVAAVETGSGFVEGDVFVVAAGAWSKSLLEGAGIGLPIVPVKGQMLLLGVAAAPVRHILLGDDVYIIPRKDGHVLVGSTVEHSGYDKTPTPDAQASLMHRACTLLPTLRTLPLLRQWAGLRPGSSDGLPFVGAIPGIDNLYVNAGQYRLGITLAPACARLITSLILGKVPDFDPTPFSLLHRCAVL